MALSTAAQQVRDRMLEKRAAGDQPFDPETDKRLLLSEIAAKIDAYISGGGDYHGDGSIYLWDTGINAVEGDLIIDDYTFWYVTAAHITAEDTRPCSGNDWTDYFAAYAITRGTDCNLNFVHGTGNAAVDTENSFIVGDGNTVNGGAGNVATGIDNTIYSRDNGYNHATGTLHEVGTLDRPVQGVNVRGFHNQCEQDDALVDGAGVLSRIPLARTWASHANKDHWVDEFTLSFPSSPNYDGTQQELVISPTHLRTASTLDATGVAATNVISTGAVVHGLAVNDRVILTSLTGGSGITDGQEYYVKSVPSTTTITISATQGGTTLDFTTDLSAGKLTPSSRTNRIPLLHGWTYTLEITLTIGTAANLSGSWSTKRTVILNQWQRNTAPTIIHDHTDYNIGSNSGNPPASWVLDFVAGADPDGGSVKIMVTMPSLAGKAVLMHASGKMDACQTTTA